MILIVTSDTGSAVGYKAVAKKYCRPHRKCNHTTDYYNDLKAKTRTSN